MIACILDGLRGSEILLTLSDYCALRQSGNVEPAAKAARVHPETAASLALLDDNTIRAALYECGGWERSEIDAWDRETLETCACWIASADDSPHATQAELLRHHLENSVENGELESTVTLASGGALGFGAFDGCPEWLGRRPDCDWFDERDEYMTIVALDGEVPRALDSEDCITLADGSRWKRVDYWQISPERDCPLRDIDGDAFDRIENCPYCEARGADHGVTYLGEEYVEHVFARVVPRKALALQSGESAGLYWYEGAPLSSLEDEDEDEERASLAEERADTDIRILIQDSRERGLGPLGAAYTLSDGSTWRVAHAREASPDDLGLDDEAVAAWLEREYRDVTEIVLLRACGHPDCADHPAIEGACLRAALSPASAI